jgi:plastocyanin
MLGEARWFACAVAGVLVLGGCSKGGGKSSTSGGYPSSAPSATPSEAGATTPLANGEVAAFHGTKDVAGTASVELELDDFYFGPTILTGKPGQSVKLELRNEGENQHNFTLSAQGVNQTVDPGKTADVTVTFPQSASATFFCAFHGASKNMRGDLRTSG